MHAKRIVKYLSICLLTLSNFSYAQLNRNISNDPTGRIYISKPAGDVSNCGPIAALMAKKYATQHFNVRHLSSSIRKARNMVKPLRDNNDHDITEDSIDTSWWRTSDIESYFNKNKIKHYSLDINQGERAIVRELDRGNIMIINLNMNQMPRGFGSVGKPYFTFPIPGGWGHYLVVVGYKYKNNKLVFETHDSFSTAGKNRLYKASNIVSAAKKYNPQVLVVQK